MSTTEVEASSFTTQYDAEHLFPFIEDENCNITGYGHQDRAEFAASVNRYDEVCNGYAFPEHDQWDEDHIAHGWAVMAEDGERIFTRLLVTAADAAVNSLTVRTWKTPVTPETPGAFPITTLWGQR